MFKLSSCCYWVKKFLTLILLIELLLVGVFFLTPDLVSAQGCQDGEPCLINHLGGVGVNDAGQLVQKGFIVFGSISALVALAIVVFA